MTHNSLADAVAKTRQALEVGVPLAESELEMIGPVIESIEYDRSDKAT